MDRATRSPATWSAAIADAAARVPDGAPVRFATLFTHGSRLVEYYAPRAADRQTPHTRDEVYVIARGRARFFDGASRRECAPGDMLFVAAGVVHRFEQISDDFGTSVLFYGPEGGEVATESGNRAAIADGPDE